MKTNPLVASTLLNLVILGITLITVYEDRRKHKRMIENLEALLRRQRALIFELTRRLDRWEEDATNDRSHHLNFTFTR